MRKLAAAEPDELPSQPSPPAADSGPGPSGAGAADSASPPLGELFGLDPSLPVLDDQLKDIVNRHVAWLLTRHPISAEHNVLVLYQSMRLSRSDADRIYDGLSKARRDQPILLVISSRGGEVEPAYFIAKLCRQATDQAVKVAVPRQAKSAATLVCCGADEIHMGGLSELGPIDPQFGGVPALALKHSVEQLAQLATQYPGAREMLSDYLAKALNLQALGFYERVTESAKQYAERLLSSRRTPPAPEAVESLANRLVYAYKDHGFVIDTAEATALFGETVVKADSAEYRLANELYRALDFIEWIFESEHGRGFSFVGGPSAAFVFQKQRTA